MKKRSKSLKIIAALLALLMVLSLFACGKKEEPKPPEDKEAENVDTSPTVTISLNKILEFASSSWTFAEFIQKIFPDYVAYMVDDEVISAVEKKPDVPPLVYDMSKITKDTNGFRYYNVGSGSKQSWKGIDVSEHQGEIDWKMVADSGIEFVFVRLGYRGYETGKFVKDKNFDDNVKGAIENGIGVGVYFVPQAVTVDEAKEEADFVIENIKEYDINWPVVYDVEPSSSGKGRADSLSTQQYTDQIKAFCDRIQEAGYKPMVYSNTKWFVSKMDLSKLSGIDLWYAYYGKGFYFPYDFKVWQFSNTGSVNGIKGNVDQNISFVNYGAQ